MADTEGSQLQNDLYEFQKILTSPVHVSSLAFGHTEHLFAGSDDGSLRVYDLSSFRVLKAVRGLGSEVSSIVCIKRRGSELRDAWIACGSRMMLFQMDSPKMIQTEEDALSVIDLKEADNDILNELSLDTNKSHIAFSMDSGVVGVVDLSDKSIIRMNDKHESVCGTVKFIPERGREFVSGGFDTAIFHFDFGRVGILSRCKMESIQSEGEMSFSPPFVMTMTMSSTGVLAAGTADGHLWLGFAGEKIAGRKKTKKWEGLKAEEALMIRVAQGPIVAMAFSEPRTLTISTLLGVLNQYYLDYDQEKRSVLLRQLWQKKCVGIQKVNALLAEEKRIIVGGFSPKGQGVIEIWKRHE